MSASDADRPKGFLKVVDTTGSTNDDAREAARAGAAHGFAVAAHVQTAGRGRRGHVWESPRGSLYLSCVLRPQVPMHYFTGLPAVCALGVLDCLRDDLGIAGAALKWPNDIVADGAKLVGILVEAGSSPKGPYAVCGVGVNVASASVGTAGVARASESAGGPAVSDVPAAAPASPEALARTCLERLVDDPALLPGFDALAEGLRSHIVARVDAWELAFRQGRAQAGPMAPILNEYFDACPLLGHQVRALSPEGDLLATGVFAGLDCWGRATVHTVDGADVVYTSEMASLRPVG